MPADFLVLIDGSDSSVSSPTLAAANGVALSRSMTELMQRAGVRDLPLEPHPQLLFNPDSRSANLLIPGLIAILLTFSGTILAAFAIVRERERGTLEQLMVTPVSPLGVVLGKLLPYLVLAYVQLLIVLVLMRFAFRVPIHGSIGLLLVLSILIFWPCSPSASWSRLAPRPRPRPCRWRCPSSCPRCCSRATSSPCRLFPLHCASSPQVLPATHFIAISRGVIIRAAALSDLWGHVAALLAITAVLVLASTQAFKKTLS